MGAPWAARSVARMLVASLAVGSILQAPLALAQTAAAEDSTAEPTYTTVVTANRSETPAASVSSTVTVITAEDLANRQASFVADVLRDVAGLDVVRSGGPGSTTSVFTRGSNPNHTLLLVDGMEMGDPSSFDGAVDFADIGTEGVERIEILRGSASSLYGSDALGGVVNIITRKGRGPLRFTFSAEGGAYRTLRGTASASGSHDRWSYSLVASGLASGGISDASALTGNTEADRYGRTQLSGRLGWKLMDGLEANLTARYTTAELALDDFRDGLPRDDPNSTQSSEELHLRSELRLGFLDGRWRQTLGATFSHRARRVDNLPDSVNPASTDGLYMGRKTRVDWQHQLALHESNDAMVLFEAELDSARTRSVIGGFGVPSYEAETPWTDRRNVAVAVQDQQRILDVLTLTGSARLDAYFAFGPVVTYSVGGVATLPWSKTRIRANHGTGFKAPTVLQLVDPLYGNPALQPERSRSFELGLEQPIEPAGLTVGTTLFRNDIEQLVSFDSATFKPINVDRARITGLETYAQGTWGPVHVRLDHTWMEPLDLATGKDLVRRPRSKATLSVTYEPFRDASFTARLGYVGVRSDLDFTRFPAVETRLEQYVLASLMARYALTPNVSLLGRIENALDARYEEVRGYGTPGISAFMGVRAEL